MSHRRWVSLEVKQSQRYVFFLLRRICVSALPHCVFLPMQRKRKRDGRDLLLQKGGSRCDRHALHGASGCCGTILVTRQLLTVLNSRLCVDKLWM